MKTYTNIAAAELHETAAREALERLAGYAARAKNVALFGVAPFIGLTYVVALPLMGLGALAWLTARALFERREAIARATKNVLPFWT